MSIEQDYRKASHKLDMGKALRKISELKVEIASLRADNERLLAALNKYGDHLYGCGLQEERDCTCGYDDALGLRQEGIKE